MNIGKAKLPLLKQVLGGFLFIISKNDSHPFNY